MVKICQSKMNTTQQQMNTKDIRDNCALCIEDSLNLSKTKVFVLSNLGHKRPPYWKKRTVNRIKFKFFSVNFLKNSRLTLSFN